jgi:hypothetical protein
MAGVANE